MSTFDRLKKIFSVWGTLSPKIPPFILDGYVNIRSIIFIHVFELKSS
jgi:hypothetical protein